MNDYAFVQCMKNPVVLRGFLASVLDLPVEQIDEITINDRYLKKSAPDGKLGILDVRVHVRGVGDINVELQVLEYKYWENRTLFYASKMFVEDVEMGKGYEQCNKVIMIQVLGYNQCRETDYFHSVFDLRERNKHFPYGGDLEIHVVELGKLSADVLEGDENLHKWARLIRAGSEEEQKMVEKDPYIEEALKELEKLSGDPEKRQEYYARDKAIRDYVAFMTAAKEDGYEEGREENLIHVISKMLSKGLSFELISEVTGADHSFIAEQAKNEGQQ